MKNPLRKRYKRELRQDLGKYLAIFLFMLLSIGFISGFLVAGTSMKAAYDQSFEKYNIEDGHFILKEKADKNLIKNLQKDEHIKLYAQPYIEEKTKDDNTYRIYANRKTVNKISVLSGRLAKSDDEITVDRLFAENNDIKVGDSITLNGTSWKVCGLVAFSDYSALYEDNSDLMFDAQTFTVAAVTQGGFDAMAENLKDLEDGSTQTRSLHYDYAWKWNKQGMSEQTARDKSDDLMSSLVKEAFFSDNEVKDFLQEADNQAIHFSGNDIGGDRQMVIWFMYIITAILAFVFAVTTLNTIEKEATVIGTLRASGYTRAELIRHYMTLPVIITLIACVIGNILGYSLFKDTVATIYYGSYSLPTYKTLWNPEAFLLSTAGPEIIMILINFLALYKKLKLSPLSFLRGQTAKEKKSRAVRLPNIRFLNRFRLRVILQNKGSYLVLLFGILFANLLLMFGLMFTQLLEQYKGEVLDHQISKYQYVLKDTVETETAGAEKYTINTLKYKGGIDEDMSVYGIRENSSYIDDAKMNLKDQDEYRVLVSSAFADKTGIRKGEKLELDDKYANKTYTFKVVGTVDYPAGLAVFMDIDRCNDLFDYGDDYFTGYFSNTKITDIDDDDIANVFTEKDLQNTTAQLEQSMGMVFYMFGGFAVVTFALVLYVLSKVVLERNSRAISIVKILGYSNREISGLYNASTAVAVVLCLLISLPVDYKLLQVVYQIMMQKFAGWLTFYVKPSLFPEMFLIGIVIYAIISLALNRKIRKVPMDEALKCNE